MIHNHPEVWTTGTRLMLLSTRNKDNGGKGNATVQTFVSRNSAEFYDKLAVWKQIMLETPALRIYASMDQRCPESARRLFRHREIDAYDHEDPFDFYYRARQHWESCLGATESRKTKYFLFDIDSADLSSMKDIHSIRSELWAKTQERLMYPTKSGWHIITDPFNINLVPDLTKLRQTNASILWGWS